MKTSYKLELYIYIPFFLSVQILLHVITVIISILNKAQLPKKYIEVFSSSYIFILFFIRKIIWFINKHFEIYKVDMSDVSHWSFCSTSNHVNELVFFLVWFFLFFSWLPWRCYLKLIDWSKPVEQCGNWHRTALGNPIVNQVSDVLYLLYGKLI